jgi:hypothetical protein
MGKRGQPAAERGLPVDTMLSRQNPLWDTPHIYSELPKLGINIGESSVSKYMAPHRKSPS